MSELGCIGGIATILVSGMEHMMRGNLRPVCSKARNFALKTVQPRCYTLVISRIDDNPISRLQHQFEMEDLSTSSTVTEMVVNIVGKLPLPEPFKKAADFLSGHLQKQSEERVHLLL